MKRIPGFAAYFAMAASIMACSADKGLTPEGINDGGTVDLRAYRSHIITKAGDAASYFEAGTKYALFVHDGTRWVRKCQDADAAVETENHTIDYGSVLTYGDSPLSFYGATYGGTDTVSVVSSSDEGMPLLEIKERIPDDGILPDLMVSRNLTGCTGSTGSQLEMDFKHAFSKLNLYVVKQNEEDDEIKQMGKLKLLKVEIAETRRSGTFDIVSGEWNYSSEDLVETRTYYADTGGLAVDVNPESIAPASEGASYIFPNSDGDEVSIVVTLSGMTDENGNQVTDDGQPDGVVVREFNVRLMNEDTGEDMGPFVFEQNHEYTLVVTVLKDDVRTVAIAPQKYDWIDEDNSGTRCGWTGISGQRVPTAKMTGGTAEDITISTEGIFRTCWTWKNMIWPSILRTTHPNGSGQNWVCYLRNDWQFGLINDSRKALGDQIRCVRDVNAF